MVKLPWDIYVFIYFYTLQKKLPGNQSVSTFSHTSEDVCTHQAATLKEQSTGKGCEGGEGEEEGERSAEQLN